MGGQYPLNEMSINQHREALVTFGGILVFYVTLVENGWSISTVLCSQEVDPWSLAALLSQRRAVLKYLSIFSWLHGSEGPKSLTEILQ